MKETHLTDERIHEVAVHPGLTEVERHHLNGCIYCLKKYKEVLHAINSGPPDAAAKI